MRVTCASDRARVACARLLFRSLLVDGADGPVEEVGPRRFAHYLVAEVVQVGKLLSSQLPRLSPGSPRCQVRRHLAEVVAALTARGHTAAEAQQMVQADPGAEYVLPPHLALAGAWLLQLPQWSDRIDFMQGLFQATQPELVALCWLSDALKLAGKWSKSGARVLVCDASIEQHRDTPEAATELGQLAFGAWDRFNNRDAALVSAIRDLPPRDELQLFLQGHIERATDQRAPEPGQHTVHKALHTRAISELAYEPGSSAVLRVVEQATGVTMLLDYHGCALVGGPLTFTRRSGCTHGPEPQGLATMTVVATWWASSAGSGGDASGSSTGGQQR